jgi:hypothetical protein
MSGILEVANPVARGTEGLVFPENRLSKEEILELVAHRAFVGDKPSAIERVLLEFPADVAANMKEAIEKFKLSQGVEQLKEQLFDLFFGKPPSFEEPPQNHVIKVLDQTLKGPLVADPLTHLDVLEKIIPWCEPRDIIALSCVSASLRQDVPDCVSSSLRQYVAKCLSAETAFKIYGSRLRVINTGSSEIPPFNAFELIKACHKLFPLIEDDAGLTLLIMRKDLTLRELVKIAADKGITVDITGDRILNDIGDISTGQAYGVLITNNVFKNSRYLHYATLNKLVCGMGCQMPTVHEYVALCVFTQQCFKECLYGQGTFGRSSTEVRYCHLAVGGFESSRLHVNDYCLISELDGVGGRRKL